MYIFETQEYVLLRSNKVWRGNSIIHREFVTINIRMKLRWRIVEIEHSNDRKTEDEKVIYFQFSHLYKHRSFSSFGSFIEENRRDIIRLNSHSRSMSRSLSVIRETTRSEMVGRTRGHGFTILFEIRHARKTGEGYARGRSQSRSWFRASVVPWPRDKIAVGRTSRKGGGFFPGDEDVSVDKRGVFYVPA